MIRNAMYVLALLLISAGGGAWAQDAPSTQDGPMVGLKEIAPMPKPSSNGTYGIEPGITAPKIAQAVAAAYPEEGLGEGSIASCLISLVVGSDGIPTNIHVVRSAGGAFDTAAMDAIKRSKFEAGMLQGSPVPVRALVRVVFSSSHSPATPEIVQRRYRSADGSALVDSHPVAISTAEPEYSEEARRRKIQGQVLVSALVNEEGLPTDLRVEKSLGYGLDEKALECVGRYRFRPATRNGKPVAVRVNVEIQYRLY